MRIGYFADGPWSHRALERIESTPDLTIAFIVARNGSADGTLKAHADRLGVPYLTHPNVNSAEFIAHIRSLNADLNVSMSFDQILRDEIRAIAPLGFINCHAGSLPFYRGRNVLNWALINGETSFGVTVHQVDAGIDTGDIILQRHVPIEPDDDYASLLEKAYELCAATLHDALILLAAGKASRTPQSAIHPVGFYCGRRRMGDEWIDWNWPSERIHNFVRALVPPGPGARTQLGDATVIVLKAEPISDAPTYQGTAGEVVGRDPRGIVVKTGDSTLRISCVGALREDRLVDEGLPCHPVGTRFGPNVTAQMRELVERVQRLEHLLAGLVQQTET